MTRNLKQLANQSYDLLIVGAGIYGAFIAWDAALRGLSVAVVDKGDFGGATSSNNLRIIHGGLRYLQHGDLRRMRESIRERTVLMRIAPHLVHPLPFLIPTYGHFGRGKEIMSLALAMNDLIGFDRNSLRDPQKYLPRGRVISKGQCLREIPGLDANGLTGGAVWYDCQMHSSERLIFSVLHSAVKAGAEMANYVKVTGFLQDSARVFGVKAEDGLSGERFDIRAALVINASGPWVDRLLGLLKGSSSGNKVLLSKAMNIVVKRQLFSKYAVGVFSKAVLRDQDAIVGKRSRLLFITPWHSHSLIGTTHESYDGEADNFGLEEEDVERLIQEINNAYPAACLRREDVTFFHGGLLPANDNNSTHSVSLLKQYRIVDHQREDGVDRLVSVVGVKFTTARDVAQKVVDLAFRKLGKRSAESVTAETPVYGGRIETFDEFLKTATQKQSNGMGSEITRHLVYSYGSAYSEVLNYLKEDPSAAERVSDQSPVIRAEVLRGIREEMAQKLVDIVMRRTALGSFGHPGDSCLATCAAIMAAEHGWNSSRTDRELAEVRAVFSPMNSETIHPSLVAGPAKMSLP